VGLEKPMPAEKRQQEKRSVNVKNAKNILNKELPDANKNNYSV
jgi:hypothetical protein